MTDISRKFRGRPKAKQRAPRDEGPRSPRRGRSEGRRPRRARAKKGLDPTALTLMIMLPLVGVIALFLLVNKGEPEAREAPEDAKPVAKKRKPVARAPRKRPDVKDLADSKMDEIKLLFQIMSDVRTKNEEAMEQVRKDLLTRMEDYEQAEILRGSDLKDSGEIDRQKRVIVRVRAAARKGVKLLKKTVRDLERQIRSSSLSEEAKSGVLSGKSQFHKGLQNNPYVLLEKRADIELKIIGLFEKHGASVTVSGGGAAFSDSRVQQEYQRLLSDRTRLGEEIENSDLSQQ